MERYLTPGRLVKVTRWTSYLLLVLSMVVGYQYDQGFTWGYLFGAFTMTFMGISIMWEEEEKDEDFGE